MPKSIKGYLSAARHLQIAMHLLACKELPGQGRETANHSGIATEDEAGMGKESHARTSTQ